MRLTRTHASNPFSPVGCAGSGGSEVPSVSKPPCSRQQPRAAFRVGRVARLSGARCVPARFRVGNVLSRASVNLSHR
jgi:hypothetical protein